MSAYSFTQHMLAGPQLLSVSESGMVLIASGRATTIPYERVVAVRLWFAPTRYDPQRFRCRISASDGAEIVFQSTTRSGFVSFTAQPEDYRAIVRDLHARLAPRGAAVRYLAGVSALRYVVTVAFIVLILLLLVGIFLILCCFGLAPLAFIQLLVAAWAALRVVRWMRSNRPLIYAPTTIPAQVLPPGGEIAIAAPAALPARVPAVPAAVVAAPVATVDGPRYTGPGRRYEDRDFGPIAEPGDNSWSSVAGQTTHWADAERYAAEANARLDAGLIGPPKDPPPQGEQPL